MDLCGRLSIAMGTFRDQRSVLYRHRGDASEPTRRGTGQEPPRAAMFSTATIALEDGTTFFEVSPHPILLPTIQCLFHLEADGWRRPSGGRKEREARYVELPRSGGP
jgi:hypothetical protein